TGPWLYLLATLHLVITGALFAAYFTYAADLVPAGRRVEGIAIFGVAGMAPNGLGPWLGEALIEHTGFPGFVLAATGFALASLALTTLIEGPGAAAVHAPGPPTPARDLPRLALRGGPLPPVAAPVLF